MLFYDKEINSIFSSEHISEKRNSFQTEGSSRR